VVSAGVMLIPGPSNLFLLAHGIGHGRRSALAAASGVEAASAIRVVLTAAGLSAVLASSAIAFNTIRWAGVAYLVYLGVRAFRSGPSDGRSVGRARSLPLARSVRKGLVVGLGNPKMVIFFLAFFPQFISPERGSEATQILILGSVFWVIGAVWDLAFACASGSIGSWMQDHPTVRSTQSRLEGITYLGLAGWSAVSGSRAAH
jgi:threonine/homoserine/homoserine lactone efflux protein